MKAWANLHRQQADPDGDQSFFVFKVMQTSQELRLCSDVTWAERMVTGLPRRSSSVGEARRAVTPNQNQSWDCHGKISTLRSRGRLRAASAATSLQVAHLHLIESPVGLGLIQRSIWGTVAYCGRVDIKETKAFWQGRRGLQSVPIWITRERSMAWFLAQAGKASHMSKIIIN